MTDRGTSVLRETLIVVMISAALAISLTTLGAQSSSDDLGGAIEKAVASLDPGIDVRSAAVRDSLDRGSIVVAGLPTGFFVRLDGLAYPAGSAPSLEIQARPGSHRVEILNRQGDSWVTRVHVRRGARIGLRPALGGEIVIEPAPGESLPGELYLDGRKIESAPVVIDSASVGRHTAEIRSDMGVLWRSDVIVRNGAITQISLPPRARNTAEN